MCVCKRETMHSMWVVLKENVNCGSKLTDVVRRKDNNIMSEKYISRKENSERKLIHGVNSSIQRRHDINKQYYELKAGDPSRNVIEMIFRAASTDPMKQSRRIKTVLKVKNSLETLGRFEIYREIVKKKAYEQYKMHPRSLVDGNELLRFYGTTMSCCRGEPASWVSELCKEPSCGVCRIIQSTFSMDLGMSKKMAIQLSSSSDEGSSDDTWSANLKSKTVKRAAIVCRTIAGRVGNMVEAENEENYDSILSERFNNNNNTDNLIVQNPSAILPCFVVVFT